MRVLFNAISARRGGIVTYTSNAIRGLAKRGVELVVVAPPQLDVDPAATHITVPASEYTGFRRAAWEQAAWRRMVAEIRPDLLFSSANFGLACSPVPQLLLMREGGLFDPFYLANFTLEQGVRAAVTRHLRRQMMMFSIRQADHVMTPSAAMRDLIVQWVPDAADRITVNHYGTLVSRFTPGDPPRPWRDGGVLRLLYVSVYYPHKCPSVLVKAVEHLNAIGIPCEATITMRLNDIRSTVGGSADAWLLERAEKSGKITLGHVPYAELPDLYRSHDIFVFPAVSETFGHPMAEAMGVGVPIVAADTAVNREVCGEAAQYHRPFDHEMLCAAIQRIDGDPELRRHMGAEGIHRVNDVLSWDLHLDRLIKIFEAVSRRSRPNLGDS